MSNGFWDELYSRNRPVLGLSPMDGVTDAPFRYMVAKYGKRKEISKSEILNPKQIPNSQNLKLNDENIDFGVDVIFTEFVSVDALHHATGERRERLLKTFLRAQDIAPLHGKKPYEIAQVFGNKPELFAEAAELIEKLGFDGIDINMGCPAHKVEENGSGAGLIRTPKVAQEIIRRVKAATKLPVSVKTRIGVDHDVAEEWMESLMEMQPANISLHGRTLKQLYQGSADWEAIGRAAEIVHKHGGHILGNGDVNSVLSTQYLVRSYGVDGVLIGREAEGNPAVFVGDDEPSLEQRMAWILEHARVFEKVRMRAPESDFLPVRKHLAWYCKGFPGAVDMRRELVLTSCLDEVQKVVRKYQEAGQHSQQFHQS